jgi:hypothetical protein
MENVEFVGQIFPVEVPQKHRWGFNEKSCNKWIKILKYREKFQESLQIEHRNMKMYNKSALLYGPGVA